MRWGGGWSRLGLGTISVTLLLLLDDLTGGVGGAVPGIFPLLTTAWYPKPGPAESVVLGLILIKVLALRLASATGLLPIPYHLNDLFPQGIGKRSVGSNPTFQSPYNTTELEIASVERVLLSLRRIDVSDCFLRLVCQMNQDVLKGKASQDQILFLTVFRLRLNSEEESQGSKKEWSIWDVYEDALGPQGRLIDCDKKYSTCPLTDTDLDTQQLLSGLY